MAHTGVQRFVTGGSAVLGKLGKALRVYSYTMKSTAGGPGLVQLFDGTDNTGAEKWYSEGNQDNGAYQMFGESGKHFPNGCYAQIDGNVSYLEIEYVQELV